MRSWAKSQMQLCRIVENAPPWVLSILRTVLVDCGRSADRVRTGMRTVDGVHATVDVELCLENDVVAC